MDYIHINDLHFRGKHGVYARERRVEQEFEVSVRLGVETKKAATSDKLTDAVDYQEVKDKIQKIIEGSSRYLIEKLGEDIAEQILQDKRIRSAEVNIKKPEVWGNGVPGVTIFRQRE